MIQDPEISMLATDRVVEDWTKLDEDHFLDGPITPRVAVVDLDPNTEKLEPGAVYEPPRGARTLGRYAVDRDQITSTEFIQVSVFATVYRTMYMFEQKDTLGRKISWAFDGPQLLVVPRAGWMPNAYYERSSHSLQFFSFEVDDRVVHTSLSRDIVAHETAHALIDGVNPDLYDALDAQSLALHEGIADLAAMLMAFSSGRLREAVLAETRGSIRKSTAFSSIGEQFGRAIDPSGRAVWLRSLLNTDKLKPGGNPADEPEEHELSQVISGVLYGLMCELHDHYKKEFAARFNLPDEFSASGRALAVAAEQFKRMVLRGLDYMPPGEATFADFGRAILAADQAAFPDDKWRQWLRENLVERRIVQQESDLDVLTNVPNEAVANVDYQGLVDSAWVAYTFAEKNRDLLGIPDDAQFEVLPRVVVEGRFALPEQAMDRAEQDRAKQTSAPAVEDDDADGADDDDGETFPVKELLFKVRWSEVEDNAPDIGGQRRVQTGTTLVIDWNEKQIRSLLRPLDFEGRRPARDAMLRRLIENGIIEVTEPDAKARAKGKAFGTGVDAVLTDGVLRIHNTARLLHIVKDLDE